MIIKVLGPGCRNCQRLAANVTQALQAEGLQAEVDKVTDPAQIAGYGVMRTPGLVIDERLVVSGRVPGPEEIGRLLRG